MELQIDLLALKFYTLCLYMSASVRISYYSLIVESVAEKGVAKLLYNSLNCFHFKHVFFPHFVWFLDKYPIQGIEIHMKVDKILIS